MKNSTTTKRSNLLKIIMDKNLSASFHNKICRIIGNIRKEKGDKEAEILAGQITEIIESHQTEEQMLTEIRNLVGAESA
jgi:hypothetical protein